MKATIIQISKALNTPIFECAMNKIGYHLLELDSFCKDEYYFENKEGNLIYFDKADMNYICYTKVRTVSLLSSKRSNNE